MFDYNYKNIEPYLSTGIRRNNKEMPWANVFILSLLYALPYLTDLIEQADTFKIILAWIVGPIVIIMVIWSIYLGITFDKNENQYALYLGIVSQVMGIEFLGISIKFQYIAYYNKISIPFIVVAIGTYLIVVWRTFNFILKNLKTNYFRKPIKFKHPKLVVFAIGLLGCIGGLSIIFGRIARIVLSYNGVMLMISIIFLICSYPCAIGAHNIYKYKLIRYYETHKKQKIKVK